MSKAPHRVPALAHVPKPTGARAAGRHCAAGILAAALTFGLIASAAAQAPVQLSPAPAQPSSPPAAAKPRAKPLPHKPATLPPPPTAQVPAAQAPVAQGQTASRHEPDLAFGAYQRGYYMTAFDIATRRADELKDVKAMTLLGELYANGLGVDRDDKKAANWYQLAADRGDREAMFALAMFHIGGRTGTINRELGAKLLAAAYDLGLLYLEGQLFPQDFARAAELFRLAAQAGNPESQYALATLYKEGRGVPKDLAEAARLLAEAAQADNTDAQVEYAIALFNGAGVARNEPVAAALLRRAALKGSAIAQNRLANVLAVGRGVPADPVQAIKWHIVAKAGGVTDVPLDGFVQKQTPEARAAAEKAAKPWLDLIKEMRESRS